MADFYGKELPTIVDHTGVTRRLGTIPAPPSGKYMAFNKAFPDIPESQWIEVDRRPVFGKEYILDQNGFGACVGFSAACAEMRKRTLMRQAFLKLSGMFVYAQINGGVDQGAIIEDAMTALMDKGVCLDSEVPCESKYIKKANIPAAAYQTALRMKANACYTITTWAQLCTSIQKSFFPVFPVMVARGGSFEKFDAEGVCGVDAGPGNHSVGADSLLKSSKYGWIARMPNTWGLWGPFADGCAMIRKEHVAQTFSYGAGFAIEYAVWDPNDPNIPPSIK